MGYPSSSFWDALHQNYRSHESEAVTALVASFSESYYPKDVIRSSALHWVEVLRKQKSKKFSVNELLNAYSLDKEEGRALMILAEALLRIPDKATRDALIKEKVTSAKWYEGAKSSSSLLAKFAGVGLDVSRHVLTLGEGTVFQSFTKFAATLTKPVIRESVIRAIYQMGDLFIVGETVEEAITRASQDKAYGYSFDMLGEAAVSFEDADRYYDSYVRIIQAAGKAGHKGVSIKLSALHPRFEIFKRSTVIEELGEKLLQLALIAREGNVRLTVDAEESERLNISLEIFEKVFLDPALKDYTGLGLAVQAYQKRAPFVIEYLSNLSRKREKTIPVRLVKGAYWDREIKVAQELGLDDFPVFTRKSHTDVSYLLCAQKLLLDDAFKPQFASHNAHTLAAVIQMARAMGKDSNFSLQRLQGMGDDLFDVIRKENPDIPCEIYAPVGEYKDLLAYLVRRLLENGANSSFVHQIADANKPLSDLVKNPFDVASETGFSSHSKIRLPHKLFDDRSNAKGIDLSDYPTLEKMEDVLVKAPLLSLSEGDHGDVSKIMETAVHGFESWSKTPVALRLKALRHLADALEDNNEILSLIVHEGRRTLVDAVSELREAVDFCRYYAVCAEKLMNAPHILPGPVGERNELSYQARGVFVCISPWNFPLAIFTGQVVAALVCGNAVIAKPASATPKIAEALVNLAHKAGIPKEVLQLCLLPASKMKGILEHGAVAGVAFTGSTTTAWSINRTLAAKDGPIVPLIAETGGRNAMIVDSSALFEQAVLDVITSGFRSAGQRCSALRILCVQEDVAIPFLNLLTNAMKTLSLGEAFLLNTDVAPVINEGAKKTILKQVQALSQTSELLYAWDGEMPKGDFIAPQLWKIQKIEDVHDEIFGPVIQVLTFKGDELEDTVHRLNGLGYGLTFGLHTRLESTIERVRCILAAGNFYVNRSMIGAVVGVQPFGGEGMSGTGFKAGGPNYLLRFLTERIFSYNTTAAGGNASLVMLEE